MRNWNRNIFHLWIISYPVMLNQFRLQQKCRCNWKQSHLQHFLSVQLGIHVYNEVYIEYYSHRQNAHKICKRPNVERIGNWDPSCEGSEIRSRTNHEISLQIDRDWERRESERDRANLIAWQITLYIARNMRWVI